MALVAIDDHVSRALARVRLQFRDSAEVLGVIGALAKEVQAIEDAFIALSAALRDHTTATGATLDLLGKVVAAPSRGAKSDVEFRTFVSASILRNRSFGGINDAFALANQLLTTAGFWNSFPILLDANDTDPSVSGARGGTGCVFVESENGFFDETVPLTKLQEAVGFLRSIVPASVRPILAGTVAIASGEVFGFDGIANPLDYGKFYTAIDRV
jgi:hypothetical protein